MESPSVKALLPQTGLSSRNSLQRGTDQRNVPGKARAVPGLSQRYSTEQVHSFF